VAVVALECDLGQTVCYQAREAYRILKTHAVVSFSGNANGIVLAETHKNPGFKGCSQTREWFSPSFAQVCVCAHTPNMCA